MATTAETPAPTTTQVQKYVVISEEKQAKNTGESYYLNKVGLKTLEDGKDNIVYTPDKSERGMRKPLYEYFSYTNVESKFSMISDNEREGYIQAVASIGFTRPLSGGTGWSKMSNSN